MTTSTAPAPGEGGFTPGPWKHSAHGAPPFVRDPRVWIYAPVGPNHPRIATVEAVFGVDEEAVQINAANARLIAAAPDLLTDSQFLLARLDEFEVDLDGPEAVRQFYRHISPAMARLRAAIAKALSPDLSGGEG